MRRKKPTTAPEYFEANNANFVKFGEMFIKEITDEELIKELARKDLEKLAKVWKLVFELIGENSENSDSKLAELIGSYRDLGKEEKDE